MYGKVYFKEFQSKGIEAVYRYTDRGIDCYLQKEKRGPMFYYKSNFRMNPDGSMSGNSKNTPTNNKIAVKKPRAKMKNLKKAFWFCDLGPGKFTVKKRKVYVDEHPFLKKLYKTMLRKIKKEKKSKRYIKRMYGKYFLIPFEKRVF